MAIEKFTPTKGLLLEPDTSPYTGTTLTEDAEIIDGVRYTAATPNYWYIHYSYGIELDAVESLKKVHRIECFGYVALTPTGWYVGHDSFKVYKSDDNSTWAHVEDFDAPTLHHLAANEWGFKLELATPVAAKYWKVVYIDATTIAFNPGGGSGKIGEVEIYGETPSVTFTFTNPSPAHQSTVYGNSQTLQLTVTVSGEDSPYTYDATFYNATTSGVISTVSGINSGQSVSTNWSTVDSGDYGWYLTATSSGYNDTSSTYEFIKKYKCEGYVEIDGTRASGVPVRLYRRNTGELIGYTTSAGISGTFEIETIYNENHYAVAVHPTDSGTNALIYDWINP